MRMRFSLAALASMVMAGVAHAGSQSSNTSSNSSSNSGIMCERHVQRSIYCDERGVQRYRDGHRQCDRHDDD